MDLAKEIVVRHREDGHVRFQLPTALSTPPVAQRLATELHRIEGVYRVDLSQGQRKLSIRFIEHVCSLQDLGRELYRLINAIEWADTVTAAPAAHEAFPSAVRRRLSTLHPVQWLRSKAREARETVTAMSILARRQSLQQKALAAFDEDTVIHFLNDALLIFLIKLHWPQIRHFWIKQPWVYRYEWMAASYLLYLMVRSRRPKN